MKSSMNNIPFIDTALAVIKQNKLQKWETKTVVVIMTVNRASAISIKRELLPVLSVQLKLSNFVLPSFD